MQQQTHLSSPELSTDWDAVAAEHRVALRAYFESGATKSRQWRLSQLNAFERFMVEREQEILDALAADVGKPALEGFTAEVAMTIAEIKHTKKHLKRWMRPRRVPMSMVAQPGKSYVYSEPLGVALIISPWNYPFQLLAMPLVGALSAGCCAMLKPSEIAPATSALFATWLPKYLDPRAVRVMEGAVPETTALLNQQWDHIFYTGNGTVARIVMEAASKHLTPVTLELGGKSPAIVDASANLDAAAKRIVYGKFFNAGQTCVAPDYVLVHDSVHDALVTRMVSVLREFYGDDPQKSPDYARIVNSRHHARLLKLLEGADIVTGGEHDVSDRYIAPTILRDVEQGDPVMQGEIFGPILPVLDVPNIDSAIRFVNSGDKPLALYVFAGDKAIQERVLTETSAGGSTVNHVWMHLGVPDLPFGGVGPSGMGAYHGKLSFDTFSHQRAVLKKSLFEIPLMYPPYTSRKFRWIRKLM